MKCDKCGKRIWFYHSKFTFVSMSDSGTKNIVCHLKCIIKGGINLNEGFPNVDMFKLADEISSRIDIGGGTFDPQANISDLDKDLADSLK